MKFAQLIYLQFSRIAIFFLLNIAEHEHVSANDCWYFHIYLQRKFHVQHEKRFIASGSDQLS